MEPPSLGHKLPESEHKQPQKTKKPRLFFYSDARLANTPPDSVLFTANTATNTITPGVQDFIL